MTQTELAQWIKTLIKHNNIHAFYCSTSWEHLRREVLKEHHNECQLCKAKGLYSKAVVVHHIKYVRQYPQLALTKDNLIALCHDCHFNIHHNQTKRVQLNSEKW